MATQLTPGQLRVVPIPETQKEIENTLDAPRRISEAIENFKGQRADAEAELVRSLRKDLAAAPLNIERAIEKHKDSKARDEALAAKIETAEALAVIIAKRIEESKNTQPEVLKAVLRRRLEQLEKEAAAEQDKAELNALIRLSPGVLRGINFSAEDGGPAPAAGGVPRVEILFADRARNTRFRLPAPGQRRGGPKAISYQSPNLAARLMDNQRVLAKLFHYRLSTPTLNESMGKLLPKLSSPI